MTELLPFQQDGIRAIHGFNGRCLLADEQGLGKTLQALRWIQLIYRHRPAVIVTPSSVKYSWQAEAALHFNLRTEVLEGFRPKRKTTLPGDIIILNYDILPSWVKVLRKHRPRVVVFDEAHYLKNPRAKRTRAAHKLVQRANSVLGLSGTPIKSCPAEFWSILHLIRPDLFPDFSEYAWEYCDPKKTIWGWKFKGATNMGKLNRILLRECMVRRLKKEVAPELPPKQRCVVPIKLRGKALQEYRKAETDFLGWLGTQSPTRAAKARKSPALVKVGYLLRLVAKLKQEFVCTWIREFLESHPDKKLIAFTMNTFVIEYLKKEFPGAVVINGKVKGRKRIETVRSFTSNRRVRLLLGQWIAAGVGLNLQAAHNVVSLDFPWTPADLLQGEDRAHRIGQKTKVLIHYLVTLGTIEEKLMRALQKAAKVLDAVLNGNAAYSDLNIFETLLKEMKHG